MKIIQAGAILISNGCVLLRQTLPDIWSFPKGSVEPGEAPVTTARRELLEETGIEGHPKRFVCRLTFERRGQLYDLRLYRFSLECETGAAAQHLGVDAHWVTIEDAYRRLSFPQYQEALRTACKTPPSAIKAPSKEICSAVNKLLRRTVQLEPLSSFWGCRPSYRILKHALKVRVFESDFEARRAALILDLAASLPTPKVVACDGPLLVTTWLEGSPVNNLDISRSLILEKAGTLLARLHSLPISKSEKETAAREAYGYLRNCCTTSVDCILEAGLVNAKEADFLRNLFESLMPQKIDIVPVHWDFVPNNLLWRNGELALIDFEGSRLFPAGYDLSKSSRLIARDIHECKAFLRGYAAIRPLEPWQTHRYFYDYFSIVRNLANRVEKRPHLDLATPLATLASLIAGGNPEPLRSCLLPSKTIRLDWKGRGNLPTSCKVGFQTIERSEGPITGKLFYGDCLEVMHTLKEEFGNSVNLIYFDPPFGSGVDLSLKVRSTPTGEVDNIPAYKDTWTDGLDSYLQWCEARLKACLDLLSSRGWLIVHTGHNSGAYLRVILDELMGIDRFAGEIIWHFHWGQPSTDRWPKRHGTMLAYRMSVGSPYYPTGDEDVWMIPVASEQERTGYDTQKPVKLLTRIIDSCTSTGDLVLDPFAGSGTTLVSAVSRDRRWIGIECGLPAMLCTRKRLCAAGAGFEVVQALNFSAPKKLLNDICVEHSEKSLRAVLLNPASIDYWGVDWNYQDLFVERWQSFRTRLNHQLVEYTPWIASNNVGERLAIRGFDTAGREHFAIIPLYPKGKRLFRICD